MTLPIATPIVTTPVLLTLCVISESPYFAMATSFRLPPATRPLLRGQLTSRPANGHVAFIPQVRKVVFEVCDKWPSSVNTRTYIHNELEELARANPHVEFVVKQRTQREPIIRGFYRTCRCKSCIRVCSCPTSQQQRQGHPSAGLRGHRNPTEGTTVTRLLGRED